MIAVGGRGMARLGFGAALVGLAALTFLLRTSGSLQDAPLRWWNRSRATVGLSPSSACPWCGCASCSLLTVMGLRHPAVTSAAPISNSYGLSMALATSAPHRLLAGLGGRHGQGDSSLRGDTQERNVAVALSVAPVPGCARHGHGPAWGVVASWASWGSGRASRAVARHARAPRGHQHLRPGRLRPIYGFVYSGIDVGLASRRSCSARSWTRALLARPLGRGHPPDAGHRTALTVGSKAKT